MRTRTIWTMLQETVTCKMARRMRGMLFLVAKVVVATARGGARDKGVGERVTKKPGRLP